MILHRIFTKWRKLVIYELFKWTHLIFKNAVIDRVVSEWLVHSVVIDWIIHCKVVGESVVSKLWNQVD